MCAAPLAGRALFHFPYAPPQVVVGRRYSPDEIAELSALFNAWVAGLFTVAPFDLPFLPYSKALRAREVRPPGCFLLALPRPAAHSRPLSESCF